MAVTIDGTNGITSPDFEPSSSTTPTNGLFLPAANAVGFATNSTERLRLDASGNLGLGVTPSAWVGKAFEIGYAGSAVQTSASGYMRVMANTYQGSGGNFYYAASATKSALYEQNVGQHIFYTAGTGTAGAAITFTQAMTLDASGNLGIGSTSPLSAAGYTSVRINNATNGGLLELTSNNTRVLQIQVDSASATQITTVNNGSNPYLAFGTNSTERARIDTSGNLLVGTTSASETANVGVKLLPTGNAYIVNAASTGASEGFSMYSTGAGAWRFYCTWAGQIYATSTTITGISDQRLKENVRDLDDGLATILALKPRKFDWKEGKGKDIKDDRGFIAQEFEQVFPDLVDTWKDEPPEGEEPYKAVRPDLIPVLVKAIQELNQRLEALENK